MKKFWFALKLSLAISILVASTGCILKLLNPAPKRTFKPQDLLVTQEDVPSGWTKTAGPQKVSNNTRSSNSSEIKFSPKGSEEIYGFGERVFRYSSIEGAKEDYTDAITFPGITHVGGWTFKSDTADDQKISCYTYRDSDIPVCTWEARYQEFVIEVVAWIGPDQVSIQEMESLVKVIDGKVKDYLGQKTK